MYGADRNAGFDSSHSCFGFRIINDRNDFFFSSSNEIRNDEKVLQVSDTITVVSVDRFDGFYAGSTRPHSWIDIDFYFFSIYENLMFYFVTKFFFIEKKLLIVDKLLWRETKKFTSTRHANLPTQRTIYMQKNILKSQPLWRYSNSVMKGA